MVSETPAPSHGFVRCRECGKLHRVKFSHVNPETDGPVYEPADYAACDSFEAVGHFQREALWGQA